MQIDVFTLFPEWFGWFQSQRHVRNALRLGHELRLFNYRDTTPLPNGQVDDSPYGGGAGMLIRVDVVDAALQAVYGPDTGAMLAERRVAVLTPAGRPLDDARRRRAGERRPAHPAVRPLRGHRRARARAPRNDALSVGPYVLSGGELAAMVVADAVLRKLPGALGRRAEPGGGVVQRGPRGRGRVPALHAPGVATADGRCRTCSCPDTTSEVRRWRLDAASDRSRAVR